MRSFSADKNENSSPDPGKIRVVQYETNRHTKTIQTNKHNTFYIKNINIKKNFFKTLFLEIGQYSIFAAIHWGSFQKTSELSEAIVSVKLYLTFNF